jgi:hypothetical protein
LSQTCDAGGREAAAGGGWAAAAATGRGGDTGAPGRHPPGRRGPRPASSR